MPLVVQSVFLSINGEVCQPGQGSWAVFLRMSGCKQKCSYCDTKYSWEGGKELSREEIITLVQEKSKGCKNITITGGEPLEQFGDDFIELLNLLSVKEYQISIETNGVQQEAIQVIADKYPNISLVVDYKMPSAGPVNRKMNDALFFKLPENCFIKFVIDDLNDFTCALEVIRRLRGRTRAKIYFSPCNNDFSLITSSSKILFNWMKDKQPLLLDVGFNLQIHKQIFGNMRDEEE
jgi:7-carboxy-7-deazaguanine synthase